MTPRHRQPEDRSRAFGSLGLSALVHGAALGALALAGGLFVAQREPAPRQLTFEAPRLADLVEEAVPDALVEVATAEPLDELDAPPEDLTFADTWVVAPDPDPEWPGEAALEEPPYEDWAERVLRDRPDFEVRPRTTPTVEEPEPFPVEPVEPEPRPEEQGPPTDPAPKAAPAAPPGPLPAPPRLEGRDPDYPKTSQRRREEGDVTLRLELDPEGRVVALELTASSGHRRLDEAVMAVAPFWRFDVTGLDAATLERGFLHTVRFRMQR